MEDVAKMAPVENSESVSFNPISTIKTRICHVCMLEKSKYKCPTCQISYCSLICYKRHKDTPCTKLKEIQQNTIREVPDVNKNGGSLTFPDVNKNGDEDAVTISEEILQNLGRSKEVTNSLCNSDLRKILTWINSTKDPHRAIHTAMMEPIFVDFVDECLNVIDRNETNGEMSD